MGDGSDPGDQEWGPDSDFSSPISALTFCGLREREETADRAGGTETEKAEGGSAALNVPIWFRIRTTAGWSPPPVPAHFPRLTACPEGASLGSVLAAPHSGILLLRAAWL